MKGSIVYLHPAGIIRTVIISLLLLFTYPAKAQTKREIASFGSPVTFPIILSSNYGELRTDHFHSGIDIKTEGVSGKKIVAVETGYISRISVSPGGFGKALYLSHPNGYSTVYGHLSSFTEEVEAYVKKHQYQEKTFQINLFPKEGEFLFAKGEIIGYSGNTGSSLGPHLHFEVRDSRTENPLNPLLFNFNVDDTIHPVFYSIFLYPLALNSHVDFKWEKKRMVVVHNNGTFSLEEKNQLAVGGMIGIGIEASDFLNGARNRCGIYSIEVLLDQVPHFYQELDEFSFNESRYVNSHIDYEEKVLNNHNIHQTFVAPNNNLSIYKLLKDRGRLSFFDNENHEITLIIKDAYQNESRLDFIVASRWNHGQKIARPERTYTRIMLPDVRNIYQHYGFELNIPAGGLYDTLYFTYAKSPGLPGSYSEVHHFHNELTPVHRYFDMRIVPDSAPAEIEEKLLIASLDENNEIHSMGGEFKNGAVEVRARNFGRFVVVADTIPPEINPITPIDNNNFSGKQYLRFRISDDLSGIRSYNGFIDDQWVLFEYDPKNELLIYRFDRERLTNNKHHELVLTVIDNKKNISVYQGSFFW